MPIEQTTQRLQMPLPYLTNPLKIDVGRLTDAINMLDANAVMLNDWDITASGWQKMGTIKGLAQGRVAVSLMVVTGSGFANILFKTGDGSVTTVNAAGRLDVSAQTNLGQNTATILAGKVIETSKDNYEVWFNIDPAAPPMKWTGLLIAGNGATIDWTGGTGTVPAVGYAMPIARSLTDTEIAKGSSPKMGDILTVGYLGIARNSLPLVDASTDLNTYPFRIGETIFVDNQNVTNWPAAVKSGTERYWFIKCTGINDLGNIYQCEFSVNGSPTSAMYSGYRNAAAWNVRRIYTTVDRPTAAEVGAVPVLPASTSDVINLNDRILPAHYGVMAIMNAVGAVAANNYPYDEIGQLFVLPFGVSGGVTQMYITATGRVAARSYNGSTFQSWRRNAMAGVNDDITSMVGLTGSLKLGGDAVGDYDAVTLRQLRSSSGGSGPTMNGVMNNFIGSVQWFNGSRAKIPAGYIAADGQEVSQTDQTTADLYAAVNSDMLVTVTNALWLNSGTVGKEGANRGAYVKQSSAGKFRVPDLNGAYADGYTPGANFLRGDGGGKFSSEIGGVGAISWCAAPNITGDTTGATLGSFGQFVLKNYTHGAFFADNSNFPAGNGDQLASGGNTPDGQRTNTLRIDASKSNAAYGRGNEVRPNSAVGIWIIRASGTFVAANTNFGVFNGDTTLPSNNTSIKGGLITSSYQVAGVNEGTASLQMAGTVGVAYSARISVFNKTRNNTANFDFSDDGAVNIPGTLTTSALNVTGTSTLRDCRGITMGGNSVITGSIASISGYANNTQVAGETRGTQILLRVGDINSTIRSELYPIVYPTYQATIMYSLNGSGGRNWQFRQDNGAVDASGPYNAGSDIRIKNELEKVKTPLKAMMGWRGVTYLRDDANDREVGLVAQDVEKDAPEAISIGRYTSYDQKTIIEDFKHLNYAGLTGAYLVEGMKDIVNLLEEILTDPESAGMKIAELKRAMK